MQAALRLNPVYASSRRHRVGTALPGVRQRWADAVLPDARQRRRCPYRPLALVSKYRSATWMARMFISTNRGFTHASIA